jgi:hypothetical protein
VWEKQVPDGGNPSAADDALFGTTAPRRFTARRVPDNTNIGAFRITRCEAWNSRPL